MALSEGERKIPSAPSLGEKNMLRVKGLFFFLSPFSVREMPENSRDFGVNLFISHYLLVSPEYDALHLKSTNS